MISTPILTYHKISYQKEFGLTTVKPDIFKAQLYILKNLNYCSKIFRERDDSCSGAKQEIILTFDDGYESVYLNAFPVMHEFNFRGVLFIITDYINKKNEWESYPILRKSKHLTRNQIRELHQAGFEIGSHGRRHLYLNNKADDILKTEIEDSKKIIEDMIGAEVITFCYPFGRFNQKVVEYVRKAGYKFALGRVCLHQQTENDNWQLSRRTVYALDREKSFLKKISLTNTPYPGLVAEWIIQQGALVNIFRQNLNNYK
jgi:peptidoglycan/xylan/chitin deacetylase (PgdA/CDA1 family)